MANTALQKKGSPDQPWTSLPQFLRFNLALAAILMALFCPSCFLTLSGLQELIPQFIFSFLASSALSYGGYLVDFYFDARLSWIKYPLKRLLLTVLFYGFYSFTASFILVFLFTLITGQFSINNIPWKGILSFTQTPMSIAFVIMALFTSRSWLMEWRNAAIEAEQLKSEKLASQNQSLKDQLNPHFLFNSLNALSNLVYQSPDKSAAFIQQLSKIYRYVLDVHQEELVSLKRELEFAENFLSLQKIRFEESLIYNIKVTKTENFFLPPLSLQLLMENAIKHNIASSKNPLKIRIEQNQENLLVSNNLQLKIPTEGEGKGIGLDNIKNRYALLSNLTIKIIKTETEYIVELPLIRMENFSSS